MEYLSLMTVMWMYFLPALIAGIRRHRNRLAIGVMNLILGWTAVGWIICLVWCLTCNVDRQGQHPRP